MSDFTETFAHRILHGIIQYSKGREPWIVSKMPPAFKIGEGIPGVIRWAKQWNADAIIGQFTKNDNVGLFKENGIYAIAQDYEERFSEIPNLTGDYFFQGRLIADFFINRGYKNFAFFGYANSVWSHERGLGFKKRLDDAGFGDSYYIWEDQSLHSLWYYDFDKVTEWVRTLPLPLAIFACDDTQANKMLEVCRSLRLSVPDDIAVIGVDNDDLTCTLSYPKLSSLDVNLTKAGYECAELIDRMIANKNYNLYDIVISPSTIITRQSTDVYSTDDASVRAAISFIHTHVLNNLNVEDVLEEVPISRRALEQRFKSVTGMGIYQYIKKMRIDKFAEYLLTSDDPINTIADRFDFHDHKNISRVFKSVKGCTPEEFRARSRVR